MATKGKSEKLPGSSAKAGSDGKMKMEIAKKSDSDKLGKAPKGGKGGFKNKAMEHKR